MLFLWLPPQKYCFFPIHINVLCFLRKYFRMQIQNQTFQSVWIRALWAIERISEPFLFTYRTSSRGTSVHGHCLHAFSRGLLWGRVSPLWTSLYFRILFQPPSDYALPAIGARSGVSPIRLCPCRANKKTGQHVNRTTRFFVKIIIVLFIYWFSYFKNYKIHQPTNYSSTTCIYSYSKYIW